MGRQAELKELIRSMKVTMDNTDNFDEKMDLADAIHKLQMEDNGVEPTQCDISCDFCGA
jgi:molybdopterin/thiamine biosynthesis adenylyltransferase|tara:strand:+ start:1722 stop:1898 length:177 start_codon:yes stop_codon:yes gene_type:complete